MKYKQQILTRVDGLKNQLDYLRRQIESAKISGPEAVKTLNEILRRVEGIEQLIESES